ncbi:hypothetical protein NE236_24880 [Actinoallomurus purpureus]|uniref:hypothetical protein n=1 Tax=Actinoallomurus purpureus TaxID=478114 RepID=UPI0020931F45|nr:hypothetical protein [Actinoallomurus purpureus]MCO6008218.1 hypothetical protein [Actinoallomurus purpureus]
MRLKKASLTFAGTAAALAVATMTASPAWACNDRDPKLQLRAACGVNGQPNWMVYNPNGWGRVPFTWSDSNHAQSSTKLWAPARGSVALPTHASKVNVIAYRPDRGDLPVWQRHGTFGVAHCKAAPKPPHPHPSTPSKSAKPSAKPSTVKKTHTATPTPVATAPSGEARPATPVKAQPKFTG